MTEAEAARRTAAPTDQFGTGGIAQAFDALGNPVCPDCGCGPAMMAAIANSRGGLSLGSGSLPCLCRPPDLRMKDEPVFRAEALLLLGQVLDELERLDHPLMCGCPGCRALELIREGRRR